MVEVYEGERPFIKLGELEFGKLRTDLGNYIQSSGVFNDYDFEGSAMSALIDLLAYNSTLYGYYASMIANESFLDTAQRRESVYSLVKPLSYLPTSRRGARAQVIVTGEGTVSPGDLFVGNGFKWTPIETYNVSGNTEIELYQGQSISDLFYSYDRSIPHQKFEIPSSTVDTSTLRVFVDEEGGNPTEFVNVNDYGGSVAGLTGGTKVYFLSTSSSDRYAIYFGDGFFGHRPNDQSLVQLDFYETAGPEGNNVAQFVSNVSGINVVSTVVAGVGGSEIEDLESVRTNAPLFFQTQGRYVTAQDHAVGLRQETNGIIANVWGGEENDPPNYGRIYVSAIGSNGDLVTEGQRENVLSIMKEKGVVTILPTFVDPTEVKILISGNVFFDPTQSPSTIDVVTEKITNFISTYQANAFDTVFNYPRFSVALNDLDSGIVGDTLEVFFQKTIEEGTISDTIPLRNSLVRSNLPGVVRSTTFLANVDGNTILVYIFDDGAGIMKMFNSSSGTFIKNVGSVNYDKGFIQLNDIQNTTEFFLNARARSNTVIARGSVILSTAVGDLEVLST